MFAYKLIITMNIMRYGVTKKKQNSNFTEPWPPTTNSILLRDLLKMDKDRHVCLRSVVMANKQYNTIHNAKVDIARVCDGLDAAPRGRHWLRINRPVQETWFL